MTGNKSDDYTLTRRSLLRGALVGAAGLATGGLEQAVAAEDCNFDTFKTPEALEQYLVKQHRKYDMLGEGDPKCLAEGYAKLAGRVHNKTDDLEQALEYTHTALRLDPRNPTALQQLGSGQYLSKEYEKAEKNLRLSLRIDPSIWEAHNTLGKLLYRTGNPEGALKHLIEAYRLGGTDSQIPSWINGIMSRYPALAQKYQNPTKTD